MSDFNGLLRDPLFQLNFMLWLVWSRTPRAGIRPIFREAGYDLQSIAPTLATELDVRAKANVANLPIGAGPKPELLLRRDNSELFLIIECKSQAFGPDADQAKQATALLTIQGSQIAANIGLAGANNWTAIAGFVTTDSNNPELLDGTLGVLTGRLRDIGIATIDFETSGLYWLADGIYLRGFSSKTLPIDADLNNGVRISELQPENDPRTLYLVPIDPSINYKDSYGQEQLKERLRGAVMIMIGRQLDKNTFTLDYNDIIEIAIPVWGIWEDTGKRTLWGDLRKDIRRMIAPLQKLGATINHSDSAVTFEDITIDIASQIRKYLMSSAFRGFDPSSPQLSFDDL